MIYNGVPGGEDQNLAYRLTRSAGEDGRLFVHEPPFIWHPERREPAYPVVMTNACSPNARQHVWGAEQTRFGVHWRSCIRCPYMQILRQRDPGRPMVIRSFDPRDVRVDETHL